MFNSACIIVIGILGPDPTNPDDIVVMIKSSSLWYLAYGIWDPDPAIFQQRTHWCSDAEYKNIISQPKRVWYFGLLLLLYQLRCPANVNYFLVM